MNWNTTIDYSAFRMVLSKDQFPDWLILIPVKSVVTEVSFFKFLSPNDQGVWAFVILICASLRFLSILAWMLSILNTHMSC